MRQNALGGGIGPSDRNQVGHLRAIACAVALTVAIPGPKASGEAANTTPSKTPPSYVEADRSDADQVLGPALTDNVFSDRFTALRKQLVAASLRGMRLRDARSAGLHARGRVTGKTDRGRISVGGTYAIKCKERVRRTFLLFLSVKEGMKRGELARGIRLPTRSCNGTSFQARRPRP